MFIILSSKALLLQLFSVFHSSLHFMVTLVPESRYYFSQNYHSWLSSLFFPTILPFKIFLMKSLCFKICLKSEVPLLSNVAIRFLFVAVSLRNSFIHIFIPHLFAPASFSQTSPEPHLDSL